MNHLPIGPEDNFLGGGGLRRWHSIHTATGSLGIDGRTLRKILLERGAIAEEDLDKPDNKILCRVEEVEAAAGAYHDAIDIQAIAKRMGLTESTVRSIRRTGLLEQIYGTKRGMKLQFSRTALDALMTRLTEGLEEREPGGDLVDLKHAWQKATVTIADIVIALAQGKLPTRYLSRNKKLVGLARLLLNINELQAEFKQRVDGLKRHEFQEKLGLYDSTGTDFFDSGFFETFRLKSRNGLDYDVVKQESFDAFFKEHASLAELSKGWMKHNVLKRALDAAGVSPVWTSRGRRIATFYRREDVEKFKASLS
ncbi:hypothetical protein M0654_19850 [Rhizobium sp. NTR19]|uniref:Uncharacterized protein n=1 Tax=Neorhizobium turbinariae TaxID=2937795 RepID=A0ABT0IWG9_9HYPH|nr:hypothetical protein [Neorhizobium turbinariae]MCK8782237.1 hypothetical protein [Neorhizobium turbinariae]